MSDVSETTEEEPYEDSGSEYLPSDEENKENER